MNINVDFFMGLLIGIAVTALLCMVLVYVLTRGFRLGGRMP